MKTNPVVAISHEDHKLAALLFDFVVPMSESFSVPKEVKFKPTKPIRLPEFYVEDALAEIEKLHKNNLTKGGKRIQPDIWEKVKNELSQKTKKQLKADKFFLKSPDLRKKVIAKLGKDADIDDILAHNIVYFRNVMDEATNSFIVNTHKTLTSHNIRSVPLYKSTILSNLYFREGTTDAVEITLHNMPVINTSKIDWNQILEIRKDKKFSQQLRNFRLFINENYSGKDKYYIYDSLSKKLEDYQSSCKEHGIKVTLSTISQTLDSKSLLGVAGIIAACILTGNTTIANLGLISGAMIELGQISIGLLQKSLEFKRKQNHDELGYLVKLKELNDI